MPTFYVEDFDGEKNADAVEREPFSPITDDGVTAKVIEGEKKPAAKKTTAARTKAAKSS